MAAGQPDHPHLGGLALAAARRPGPGRAALPRFITRRFWCVLARHRLHRLCYEARLHTRAGRLPLVLWIRPTQVGERAWVLCRAGICAEDFEAHIGELRAACFAREARVTRNRRWSHLVTIDIIRHDTLAASNTITSPLARLTAHYQHHPALALVPPRLRRRARAQPPNPDRRSPWHAPGGPPHPDPLERRHLP